MGITNKGRTWENGNSLWLIWSFIMFLNFIPFFWIGVRAKQKKWLVFGLVYFMFCFFSPVLFVGIDIYANTSTSLMLIAWIVSIIHAFLSRKEYLIRREIIIDNIGSEDDALRQKIQNEYAHQQNAPVNESVMSENEILACKRSVDVYLTQNESTAYFRERLMLISARLEFLNRVCGNIQKVITERFGSAGLSYDKFAAPVIALQDHSIKMVDSLVVKMNIFYEEEYQRKIEELTQANRLTEAQEYIDVKQEYKDYAEKTLTILDQTIVRIDKLILEISKLNEADLQKAKDIIQELDRAIKDAHYYK